MPNATMKSARHPSPAHFPNSFCPTSEPNKKIVRTVQSGSYRRLEDGSLVLLKEAVDLADLRERDFLVVLRVVGGEIVAKGQRIFDLQRRGPMTDRNSLLPEVKTCLTNLASRLGIDPGWQEGFDGYENRDE